MSLDSRSNVPLVVTMPRTGSTINLSLPTPVGISYVKLPPVDEKLIAKLFFMRKDIR